MNDKIKRFTFYNIFFLCAFCCLFMVLSSRSYASKTYTLNSRNGLQGNPYGYTQYQYVFTFDDDKRYAVYCNQNTIIDGVPIYSVSIWSDSEGTYDYVSYYDSYTQDGSSNGSGTSRNTMTFSTNGDFYASFSNSWGNNHIFSSMPIFYDYESLSDYLENGVLPELPFDNELQLDSLKVKSWQLGTSQGIFKSSFEVTWSDPNITLVQVIIDGPTKRDSFESSVSSFKQKFSPGQYVLKKGDVVHITATPYKADGSYGVSLYQSFEYDDNIPGSNIYRKFTNTPYSDNTLTIPYTGVSGQPQSVTLPVDGVATQNVYKVNYNPQTYEYGDINLYEIYYSPVVVYPSDATDEEIDETQEVINNTYTTNNYYETTKNINIDFDVSFGDISGSDIQHGFDDFGDFGNGFGSLLGKLSSWVLALFPFLNPIVASAIVIFGGLVIGLAIIAFVLKIASVIADLIPF